SPIVRELARDEVAAQEQLAGATVADLAGQIVHDDGGDQAAPDLRVADACGLGGDGEVAGGHHAGSASQGIAVHSGDRRLGQGVDALEQVGELLEDLDNGLL